MGNYDHRTGDCVKDFRGTGAAKKRMGPDVGKIARLLRERSVNRVEAPLDLTGKDLTGLQLSSERTGKTLFVVNVSLSNCTFQDGGAFKTVFKKCFFDGARLVGAGFKIVHFHDGKFRGTVFEDTLLENVRFSGNMFKPPEEFKSCTGRNVSMRLLPALLLTRFKDFRVDDLQFSIPHPNTSEPVLVTGISLSENGLLVPSGKGTEPLVPSVPQTILLSNLYRNLWLKIGENNRPPWPSSAGTQPEPAQGVKPGGPS